MFVDEAESVSIRGIVQVSQRTDSADSNYRPCGFGLPFEPSLDL